MIKVAHESPLAIMPWMRNLTDYDYALVHLFPENQEYYNFFHVSLRMGRKVVLDNSLFELGSAFNSEEYVSWINSLAPQEYIIPDALGKTDLTIELTSKFLETYVDKLQINPLCMGIGVVQGSTLEDMVR